MVDDMPPELARILIEGARKYYATPEGPKRAEVAVRHLRTIREHMKGKVRLPDVEALFAQLRREGMADDLPKPPSARRRR